MKVSRPVLRAACGVGFLFTSASCVSHIAPYKAKRRKYVPTVSALAEPVQSVPGRIFRSEHNLTSGTRTFSSPDLGDIVVVVIGESSTAQHDATQTATKASTHTANLPKLLGIMTKLKEEYSDFDPAALIELSNESDFAGNGSNRRVDEVQATVAGEVRQVLPNGNLFVEGHRVVHVHDDEVHYYVSGVCRPRDIDGENQVRSSQMLDVQVEISCRGPVCNASKKGWFGRFLDWVWPL